MSSTILSSKDLIFQHRGANSLSFQDIRVQAGQHTLLLGESGTGKTTLLHLLGGLSKPTLGHVYIQQQDIYQLHNSQLDQFRAQHIGFIFQEAHLLKNLSIVENIVLAQSLAKRKEDKRQVMELLDRLQIADQANKYPKQLSRGQVQRVAIARAVINKPSLIIADEPTAALDDKNTAHVIELLQETANNYNSTLLIATHDKRLKDHFSNTYTL